MFRRLAIASRLLSSRQNEHGFTPLLYLALRFHIALCMDVDAFQWNDAVPASGAVNQRFSMCLSAPPLSSEELATWAHTCCRPATRVATAFLTVACAFLGEWSTSASDFFAHHAFLPVYLPRRPYCAHMRTYGLAI